MIPYDIPLPFSFTELSDRYHPLMASPVALRDGTRVPALMVADAAYQSEFFGAHLRHQDPRFIGRHGYAEKDMLKDLGPDAHPLGHQYELGCHVAQIIEAERDTLDLTEEEIGIVMLASLVHDMGESMHPQLEIACDGVVGDIPAGLKTDEDRIVEARVREYLYRNVLSHVSPSVLQRIESIISHSDTSVLHDLFDAAHELQTLETMQLAENVLEAHESWQVASVDQPLEMTVGDEARRVYGLLSLSRLAMQTAAPKIHEYRSQFTHVNKTVMDISEAS